MTTDKRFTVASFLRTDFAREAARRSGNSTLADFAPDDEPTRVGRAFSGHYTVDEVRALLADLEHMQEAYDKWVVAQRIRATLAAKPQPCRHTYHDSNGTLWSYVGACDVCPLCGQSIRTEEDVANEAACEAQWAASDPDYKT